MPIRTHSDFTTRHRSEHVLLGLIKEGSGTAANVLRNLDVDLRKLRSEIERIVPAGPAEVRTGKVLQTARAKKVIEYAIEEARKLNHNFVGTEHILLGLLREQHGVAAQALMNLDLKLEEVREEALNLLGHGSDAGGEGESIPSKAINLKTSALDSYGCDLTDLARRGKLHPAIGRESEIELVVQILSSRARNNTVLLGKPGVGKTAIVEGLSQRIADGNIPELLRGRRLVFLDNGQMSSGIKNQVKFDDRIKAVSSEVRKAKNLILYLHDLQTPASSDKSNVQPSTRSNTLSPAVRSSSSWRQRPGSTEALLRRRARLNSGSHRRDRSAKQGRVTGEPARSA